MLLRCLLFLSHPKTSPADGNKKKDINTLQHRGKYLLYLQLMVDTRRQSIANTPSPIPTETHVVSAHSKSLCEPTQVSTHILCLHQKKKTDDNPPLSPSIHSQVGLYIMLIYLYNRDPKIEHLSYTPNQGHTRYTSLKLSKEPQIVC